MPKLEPVEIAIQEGTQLLNAALIRCVNLAGEISRLQAVIEDMKAEAAKHDS